MIDIRFYTISSVVRSLLLIAKVSCLASLFAHGWRPKGVTTKRAGFVSSKWWELRRRGRAAFVSSLPLRDGRPDGGV